MRNNLILVHKAIISLATREIARFGSTITAAHTYARMLTEPEYLDRFLWQPFVGCWGSTSSLPGFTYHLGSRGLTDMTVVSIADDTLVAIPTQPTNQPPDNEHRSAKETP